MGKSNGGVTFWSLIKFLAGLIFIAVIIAIGIFTYKGYQIWKNPNMGKNVTIAINQETINQNTTVINQAPEWPFYVTLFFLLIAILVILYLVMMGKLKFTKPIDFEQAAEDTMRLLIRMGRKFYWNFDGKWKRIKPSDLKEIKHLGAIAWILPGSRTYYQGRVISAGRCAFRFWKYPLPEELQQTDWEPPFSEIVCVTVNPFNLLERPDFMEPITAKEMKKYLHEQEYGYDVSPEPIEARNLFELKRMEKIKDVEDEVFKQSVKEEMKA